MGRKKSLSGFGVVDVVMGVKLRFVVMLRMMIR